MMGNGDSSPLKNETLKQAACVGTLLLLAAALAFRAPMGLDWTDEPYYSAIAYRLILGDVPFVQAWEVHQLSALITLPFLRLYLLFTGGDTAGVILYYRYLLIALQLCIAVYGYLVTRGRSGDGPALLLGCIIVSYAHYGLNGLSYNMLAPLFLILSVLLLFDGMGGRAMGRKLFLSGAAYALSVQAQPYSIVGLPIWIWFFSVLLFSGDPVARASRERMLSGSNRLRPLLYFGLGGVGVLLAVLGYLLLRAAPRELALGVAGMLGDPDHVPRDILQTMGSYCNAIRVLMGPASYLAAALFVMGAGVGLVRDGEKRARLRRAGLLLCVLLMAVGAVWVALYEYPGEHKINLASFSIALAGPALYFFSGRRLDRSMLLFVLGCGLSVAVQLGSNTGIRGSSGAMTPAALGALLYLFDATGDAFPRQGARRRFRALGIIACAATAALLFGLRLTTVYRDAPLPALTETIDSGPARGVVTTPERAGRYRQLYADMTDGAPKAGNVLLTDLMPVAYLFTELSPATPSLFNMTYDSSWLHTYYQAHPERTPDYIFCVGEGYGSGNQAALSGTEALSPQTGWQRREYPSGTAFYRTGD